MKPMMMRIIFLVLFSPTVFGVDLRDSDKLKSILSELDTLKSTLQGYDTKMMELDNVKARMFSLENQVVELQQENNRLNTRVQQLEFKSKAEIIGQADVQGASPQELPTHNVTFKLNTSLTKQTAKYPGQNRIRQSRQISVDGRVAFTAGVSVLELVNLGVHHTIVFDHVLSNIGNAYHPHSGIFLAPVKGVYFFAVTLMVPTSHTMTLELVIDDAAVTHMYASASNIQDYRSTSRQWILEVNKSSEVWIRTQTPGILHGNMNTDFSGFLLFEIN